VTDRAHVGMRPLEQQPGGYEPGALEQVARTPRQVGNETVQELLDRPDGSPTIRPPRGPGRLS